jgi:hypothetical protein
MPEVPVELPNEAATELARLQAEHASVLVVEANAIDRRGGLLFDQYRFVDAYGAVSINAYAKAHGFNYEASNLTFHVSAQALLNINVGAATTDEQKEALQNAVRPLAYALAALDKWCNEHADMSREQFIAYYREQGCMTGLRDRYLADKRANRKKSVGKPQIAAAQSSEEIVDTILDNPAAKEIAALPDIATGTSGLMMFRHEGDKFRLVLLNATPDQMAGLSGLAPCALDGAPADLRFHREMMLAGSAFVPDALSNVTREDVPEGDKPNESYTFLPANAIYLVEGDHISIAHARREDGIVVQVEPKGYRPDYMGKPDLFLDNLTRRRLGNALTGEKDAEAFARSAHEGEAVSVQRRGKTTTLTFTHKDTGETVNLIVKPRNMGSVWTYRVSPAFAPSAQAVLDPDGAAKVEQSFLRELLKKAPKDRVVRVEVTDEGVRLANGNAAAMPFEAQTGGTAKLCVMAEDLRRALVGLYGLKREGRMTFKLDPQGMLCIEAMTALATYRVHVQAIEPERDEPTRCRALREKVESLPKSEAVPVQAAA